jgi:hypothetical protein
MESKRQQLEQIHLSLVNGQRKQMTAQIDEYGLYNFFEDYSDYLNDLYEHCRSKYNYFTDCVVSYHRIKNR